MALASLHSVPAPIEADGELIGDALATVREMLGMDVAYVADTRQGLLDVEWLSGDGSTFGIAAGDAVPLDGTYCQLVLAGKLDGVVRDARRDPRVAHMAVTRAADIGAYLGVPVVLPNGTVHGILCGLRHDASLLLDEVEHDFLNVLARMIGKELHQADRGRAAQRHELEQLVRDQRRAHVSAVDAQRDRVAFDLAPIGNVIVDPGGRIQRVNTAMAEMAGVAPDDLVGRNYLEMVHPDDRDKSLAAVTALIDGTAPTYCAERRMVHSSGRVVDTRMAVSVIRDEEEAVEQLFAQVEDVTEVRRTSRELHAAQSEMLARLAAAAEFRDDDTGQHTKRVGELSAAIAERLGLGHELVELIRAAAPLHDIGKIATPDAVLTKAGPLTRAEFEDMQAHTRIGWQMLSGSSFALMETAAEIALSHHERWDGCGYPAGLAGEAIPITGRVVAVADVFDALTHARPYKAAWSSEEALTEMAREGGRHFDPAVLQAFLELQGTA